MNREIKLRAWDKENKRMVYDFFYSPEFLIFQQEDGSIYYVPTNKMVIMQYTGDKDKNGREIWEGDILYKKEWIRISRKEGDIYEDVYVVVKFRYRGFVIEKINNSRLRTLDWSTYVKIGNIYKNPELIKEV